MLALSALTACGGGNQQKTDQKDEASSQKAAPDEKSSDGEGGMKGETMTAEDMMGGPEDAAMEDNGILLTPMSATPMAGSPQYPDAKLEFKGAPKVKGLKATFDFNVMNYELMTQTADAADKGLANSGKGQHIHLIVNNRPYNAIYEPPFTKEYEEGHYVALAFFARSYHESLKSESAYQLQQFNVGNSDKEVDLNKAALFYSRPKGTYSGAGAEKILFDFYLHNTTIGPDGNMVRMMVETSAGDQAEFEITKWQPYIVEGLPMGENTITIELLGPDGQPVEDALFNKESRTFTLEAGA